ncbi:hypothetical protein FACS189454_03880 [Planctomycetales bacterium]|nr:hypothetical protein FACS189454_03880 [Planctomycetales bacterium]
MQKVVLTSASVIVILATLKIAQPLIAPFFLAVFFAMVLIQPLRWLKEKGKLSDIAALFTLSSLVGLVGLGLVFVFTITLSNFANRIPDYQKKTTAIIHIADDWINSFGERFQMIENNVPRLPQLIEKIEADNDPQKETDDQTTQKEEKANGEFDGESVVLKDILPEQITPPQSKPEQKQAEKKQEKKFSLLNFFSIEKIGIVFQSALNELFNITTVSIMIAVMIIFMLIEANEIPLKFTEAWQSYKHTNADTMFDFQDINGIYQNIVTDTWNYTKVKTIVSLLTGIATTIGLWFLGVEYSLLWGFLMFILNYIPNIGQVIAAVPPVLLALIDNGFGTAVLAAIWITIVNSFFGYGVEPRYLGEKLGISSLVVLLSLIFWGYILGPIGMFLSAPLTMILKIVLQNIESCRWLAILLSNKRGAEYLRGTSLKSQSINQ